MKPVDWIIDNWSEVSKLVKENPRGFTANVTETGTELLKGDAQKQKYVVAYDTVARINGSVVTFCSKNVSDKHVTGFLLGGYKENDTYYIEFVARFWQISVAQFIGVYCKQKYIYDLRAEQTIPIWEFPVEEQKTYLNLIRQRDNQEMAVSYAEKEGDQQQFDYEFWKLKALNRRVQLIRAELIQMGYWN